jgi:hypothetical protein
LSRRIEGIFVARRSLLRSALLAFAFALTHPLAARSDVFDIPAQSLATAIDAFCAATGAEVYYDGTAARGQRSSEVAGDRSRDAAIRALLVGTDLVPLKVRDNAYLLINPGDDAARALAAARSAQDARYRRYFAVVQQSVLLSICRLSDRTTVPERLVIRVWIDPDGAVQRLEAGDAGERIANLYTSLRSLRLPETPPPHMPQPVTVALLAGASAMERHCPPTAALIGH